MRSTNDRRLESTLINKPVSKSSLDTAHAALGQCMMRNTRSTALSAPHFIRLFVASFLLILPDQRL